MSNIIKLTIKTALITLGIFFIFLMGVSLGSVEVEPVPEKVVVKRVPTEKVITKEVPVGKTYQAELKELKVLDDQIIDTAQSAITACGQGFQAVSEGDLQGLTNMTQEITELTPVMQRLMEQRREFVAKNEL